MGSVPTPGLKRLAGGRDGFTYKELLHTRRRYIDADSVRDATRRVVNATLAVRLPDLGRGHDGLRRRTRSTSAPSTRTS